MASGADRGAYRSDIDGLRAIAIIAVFLFHLDRRILPGGFVGVDVFFVISGFLITGNILQNIERGSFSFVAFWQRRIARLLPSMLLVVCSTLLASYLVYDSQDFASAGINAFAAISSIMNFKLWKQGSYFTLSPDAQPFLHFWSLSVEEQYYLLYPVVIVVLAKLGRRRLATGMILLPLLSLIFCLLLGRTAPVAAFYLLPARAWELGVGALIALYRDPIEASKHNVFWRYAGLVGTGLIAAACLLLDDKSDFPSLLTAIPVAGSALILCGTVTQAYLGRDMLGSSLMSYVGLNSFVLYLWHWPVFSLLDYILWQSDVTLRLAFKIGISVVLAIATHHLFEAPLRERLNQSSMQKLAYAILVMGVLVLGGVGYTIRNNYYIDVSASEAEAGGRVFDGKPGGGTILLLGDSNASMYAVSLRRACKDLGCKLVVGSSAAGDAMARTDGHDSEIWRASVDLARAVRPDLILYVNAWDLKLSGDKGRLRLTLDHLAPLANRIVLVTEPPHLPKGSGRAAVREGASLPFYEEPASARSRREANSLVFRESGRAAVVDAAPLFELGNGAVRYSDARGTIFYQDGEHLSKAGADIVVDRLIRPLILEARSHQAH